MADAWGHSWGGPFTRWIMWGAATQVSPPPAPSFGPPFLDFQSAIRASLGVPLGVVMTLGADTTMPDTIERQNLLRSSRIDRSVL